MSDEELGRFRGKVFQYATTKGFGFIDITHEVVGNRFEPTKKFIEQVFVYHTAIEPEKEGFKKLVTGQLVEFNVVRRPKKGLAAHSLKILEDDANESVDDDYFNQEKFNK